jgi:hypothetical protein
LGNWLGLEDKDVIWFKGRAGDWIGVVIAAEVLVATAAEEEEDVIGAIDDARRIIDNKVARISKNEDEILFAKVVIITIF